MTTLDAIHAAWTCLLIGWTLWVIREREAVKRDRRRAHERLMRLDRALAALPLALRLSMVRSPVEVTGDESKRRDDDGG